MNGFCQDVVNALTKHIAAGFGEFPQLVFYRPSNMSGCGPTIGFRVGSEEYVEYFSGPIVLRDMLDRVDKLAASRSSSIHFGTDVVPML